MIKIGITGGIGSGKTTVCKIWEQAGAKVIYADDLAKELMVTDPDLIKKIKEAFGSKSYHKDGSLNRAYLAKEAFEKGRVEEFNAIVHPRVLGKTGKLAKKAEKEGYSVFVKEAALLLKYGRPRNTDYVVVVTAPENKRIQRIVTRDRTQKSHVKERIQKQQDPEELLKYADIVINNDGSLEELEEKAVTLYEKFQQQATQR